MQIQKGIVKYKDRSDIVCNYGITDDGKQYYFLDETDKKKFSNGNRIASTLLVEAIDPMVKASNIGVIDGDGKVVIPFENKVIKPINDDIILVEKAEPTSKSVLDALSLRNNPTFAAQLVSTSAAVKERLNSKMGIDGRYFFNDQFSEATVCDINGNNLVNGEYFSFIGMANGKLYFSKNTVDCEITEYSILPPEVQSDVTPKSDGNEINVNSLDVSKDVVEDALAASVASKDDDNSKDNVSVVDGIAPSKEAVSDAIQSSVDMNNIEIPSIGADDELESVESDTTGFTPSAGEIPVVSVDKDTLQHDKEIESSLVEEEISESNADSSLSDESKVENNSVAKDALEEVPAGIKSVSDSIVEGAVDSDEETLIDMKPVNSDMAENILASDESIGQVVETDVASDSDEKTLDEVGLEDSEEVSSAVVGSLLSDKPAIESISVSNEDTLDDTVSGSEDVDSKETSDSLIETVSDEKSSEEEANSSKEIVDKEEVSAIEGTSSEKEGLDSSEEISDEEISSLLVDEDAEESTDFDLGDDVNEDESASTSVEPVVSDVISLANEEIDDVGENIFDENTHDVELTSTLDDKDDANEEMSDEEISSLLIEKDEEEVSEDKPVELNTEFDVDKLDLDFRETTDEFSSNGESNRVSLGIDDEFDDLDEDIFKDSVLKADEIVDSYIDSFDRGDFGLDARHSGRDTIMMDVANSMANLIKQNKEQRNIISRYQDRYEKLGAARRSLADRAEVQEQKIEVLTNKIRSMETAMAKLESKNQTLESKVREQEKLITAQAHEIDDLRPQLAGKEDLVKVLADAQVLLGQDSYGYDYGDTYYKNVA